MQETGTLTATKPHKSQHKSLLSYLFFIVTDGSGSLEYKGKIYPLKKGDCVFISCENEYAHITDKKDLWTLKWVHCYGDTLPAVYEKYRERGGQPVFHPNSITEYIDILDQLFEIASSEDHLRDMRINETICMLLTKIMEMSWDPTKQPDKKSGRHTNILCKMSRNIWMKTIPSKSRLTTWQKDFMSINITLPAFSRNSTE